MDPSERYAIERECERLVVSYTHLVDFGEAERQAELFTADGIWEAGPGVFRGQEELRRVFGARQRNTLRTSRHVCTNLLIEVIDEKSATGVVYLTLYRHDGDTAGGPAPLDGPFAVGQYRDRFVRTDRGWRFAHRTLEVAFGRLTP